MHHNVFGDFKHTDEASRLRWPIVSATKSTKPARHQRPALQLRQMLIRSSVRPVNRLTADWRIHCRPAAPIYPPACKVDGFGHRDIKPGASSPRWGAVTDQCLGPDNVAGP